MSPRTVTVVIGLAFFLAGVAILLVTLGIEAPNGTIIPCGNSLGLGFDRLTASTLSPAYVDICATLRERRLVWAAPIASVGVLLLLGATVVRRRSTHR
ncbi:hypothetical protein [Lentzea sp. NBRC 105346]|uniref:hypothetical protein n=1 Tax=Lentzea sp. NBRC 105346 TaxID=3032205 RepID=UPI0025530CE7|nr:hypothetical protein [Lentzea sp. NBRC 105346]